MSTTVVVYKSTDASAPTLTGAVGSLIALLDACLVNGYSGKSAAGWAKSFSGTNKATYRNSATDGTGYYLYVDDAAPSTAKEARVTGFQTQSALGVGTGQFPLNAQLSIGTSPAGAVVWRKSNTADSTARAWTLIADDTVFYLNVETGDLTTPVMPYLMAFGDFFSYASSDTNRCMLIGRNVDNSNNLANEAMMHLNGTNNAAPTNPLFFTLIGHFLAGNYNGTGGSTQFGKHSDASKCGMAGLGSSSGATVLGSSTNSSPLGWSSAQSFVYPNPPDGGLWMAPIWIHHQGMVRGYFKGLWNPLQHLPLQHGDTFTGTGAMSTKTFISLMAGVFHGNASQQAEVFVETSSTWS